MNRFLRVTVWAFMLLTMAHTGYAQQSPNVVDYQVIYSSATGRYTAWVIPRYTVPNANNTGTTEKGGTAQVTIKVPSSFSVVDIQDIVGTWDKNPLRLGPGNAGQDWTGTGLDPTTNYYVIGKAPAETDYGTFTTGVPVPVFSFRGNGCFGPVSPLEPGNTFIAQADQKYSLNVANSFYSRSAQPAGGNQDPLEQFRTTAGNPAQCTKVTANPDSQNTPLGQPVTVSVLDNDTDVLGKPASPTTVTLPVTGQPANGTAVVNPNGTITYTPKPGYAGPDSFTYTIADRNDPTNVSTTTVTIGVQSAPPTANPDTKATAFNTPTTIPILDNDKDRAGNPASLTNVSLPVLTTPFPNGTASIDPTTGVLSYTPNAGFTGTDVAVYQIAEKADPTKTSSTTVTILVDSKAPVANPDSQTTAFGSPVTIPVLANDTDKLGNPATLTNVTLPVVGQPVNGTAVVNPDGTITYTPKAGFTGPDSFTYVIADKADPTKTAVTIVTVGVQPAPVVLLPTFSISKAVNVSRAKLGDVLSYTLTLTNTGPVAGSVVATDALDPDAVYVPNSATASAGNYNPASGVWSIASLTRGGVATLVYSASVVAEGVIYNTASISSQTATVCTSVPFRVCAGTSYAFSLSVAAGQGRYQWYKDGILIQDSGSTSSTLANGGSTPNALTATSAGAYRVMINEGVSGKCPDMSCCPFVIEEVTLPTGLTLTATAPTCLGPTPKTDGIVTLKGFGSGTALAGLTYRYSTGGTGFSLSSAQPATAGGIPASGQLLTNGVGGTTYFVRIFGATLSDGEQCFVDLKVTMPLSACVCPAPVCVPIVVQKLVRTR